MSGDEIRAIVRSDFSESFNRRFKKKIHETVKDGYKNKGARIGEFSLIAKSGQQYNFYLYNMYNENGQRETFFGIITYAVSHENFNLSYYTFSVDNDLDLFTADCLEVNRYTEHAISRYMERVGKEMYGKNAFIHFMMSNYLIDTINVDDNEVISKTIEGALVGKVINGVNHFNTFYNDDMMYSTRRFRQKYDESTLIDDARYERTKNSVDSLFHQLEHKLISPQSFLDRMLAMDKDITQEYLEYAETTRDDFDKRVRDAIKKNAIRTDKIDRDTLPAQRKACLGVSSCVPGLQKGMQIHKGLCRWRIQDNFAPKSYARV